MFKDFNAMKLQLEMWIVYIRRYVYNASSMYLSYLSFKLPIRYFVSSEFTNEIFDNNLLPPKPLLC